MTTSSPTQGPPFHGSNDRKAWPGHVYVWLPGEEEEDEGREEEDD